MSEVPFYVKAPVGNGVVGEQDIKHLFDGDEYPPDTFPCHFAWMIPNTSIAPIVGRGLSLAVLVCHVHGFVARTRVEDMRNQSDRAERWAANHVSSVRLQPDLHELPDGKAIFKGWTNYPEDAWYVRRANVDTRN